MPLEILSGLLPLFAVLVLVLAVRAGMAQEEGGHARGPLPSPEEIAKLPPDGGPEFNRLVFEQSPYLRQHARNPVDWYPWGDEALAEAKRRDVPIFLSVGYSTCHWCHVMEHESFEDEEVAALLNENFVSVKVDREERPDLDQVYMTVTQALTGAGGWPMTVLLTPDGRPFFAATYIPKHSRLGRPGMMELVPQIAEVWRTRRDQVTADAGRIAQHMQRLGEGAPGGALGGDVLERAFGQLQDRFDPRHGGFGQSPKFPVPHNLVFLLQHHRRTGKPRALEMVEETLRAMRAGGIFDHVGFGFHRYSTDPEWLVPHFEKMLYDQALLAMAYTAAWQVTGDDEYRRTAEEVFAYVLRDMTSPRGGFHSAEDADSEGEEGRFYLWTVEEIREVLGAEEARVFSHVHGVTEEGNYRDEATGARTGRNILHRPRPLAAMAKELDVPLPELEARLETAREKLFAVREERVHPFEDDKVLTDWNGLMIAALARAGRAFGEERYAEHAGRAADFVLDELSDDEGRLLKRWRAGEAGLPATLEDYAFLAWGLLELYETTFEVRWLEQAIRLTDTMLARFEDAERGGFFLTADDGLDLFVRPKEIYDGALPSGNSVAALVLLKLGRVTADARYEERADALMQAFSGAVSEAPIAHTQLLAAVDFAVGPSFEVVVAGDPAAEDTRRMLDAVGRRFLPHKVLLLRAPGDSPPIAELAPYTADQPPLDGKATAYVCRNFACKAPTTSVEEVVEALEP